MSDSTSELPSAGADASSASSPSSAGKKSRRSTLHPSEQHLSRKELRERSILGILVRRHTGTISWLMVLSILSEFIHMAVPIALGVIIDRGILEGDLRFTVIAILVVIAVRLLAVGAWALSFYRTMEIRMSEQHKLRMALTAAVLDPTSRPIERPAGEVLSISTSDADRAPDVFDMLLWAVPAGLAVLGAGVWLWWVNPWIGLAVFVGLGAQVVVLRVIAPILSQKYDAQQSGAADAAATATDLVHGLRVLQGLGVQTRARAMYRSRSRAALGSALINARYSGLSNGLLTFVSTLMIAAVTLVAASLTLEGAIGLGVLISVVGLVRNMSGMMEGLSGVPVWFASFSTSARRIRHLLSELGRSLNDPSIVAAIAASPVGPEARAAHSPAAATTPGAVRTRRPGVQAISPALVGEVRAGQVLAVVPARATDATLTLGALEALDLERSQVLFEPHAVDLFDGTLREQLGTKAPTPAPGDGDRWAHAALHAAGADDLLRILPDGMDTRIQDRGANLSGGQRQRLALARAVASDTPVLVLHDPTTAVDAVTEQHIAEALVAARSLEDRITIILTKAPALLNAVEDVVFVSGGEVAGRGRHQDLMTNPDYAEVVQR